MNIHRQKLVEEIYDAIKAGTIVRDNQLFSERELCEIFGVKRGPLRDALIALDTLGIIDIRERQGMFIPEDSTQPLTEGLDYLSTFPPAEVLNQVFEFRLMLETAAVEHAAVRRTDKHVRQLEEEIAFLEVLKDSDRPDKGELGSRHNLILHQVIISAVGNRLLEEVYKNLSSLTEKSFTILGNSELNFHPYVLWPEDLLREHRAIVDAIIRQDPAAARQAMEHHLRTSQQRNNRTIADGLPALVLRKPK